MVGPICRRCNIRDAFPGGPHCRRCYIRNTFSGVPIVEDVILGTPFVMGPVAEDVHILGKPFLVRHECLVKFHGLAMQIDGRSVMWSDQQGRQIQNKTQKVRKLHVELLTKKDPMYLFNVKQ